MQMFIKNLQEVLIHKLMHFLYLISEYINTEQKNNTIAIKYIKEKKVQ